MPDHKTVDLYAVVPEANLSDSNAGLISNRFPLRLVRGDKVLIRWTLFSGVDDTTAYAIAAKDGLEFIITDQYNATTSTDAMAYAGDSAFDPADWASFSRSGGKVSCMVDTNSSNLDTSLGTTAVGRYFGALVIVPAGTCDHVTAWEGDIIIRNSVNDAGQTTPFAITTDPPCNNSSSSTSGVSSSSSSSSSTVGETTSVSSSSSSSSSANSSSSSTSFG